MSDEVAKLKRRVRQLERARQKWKGRCADKQDHIRYLRVKARDLAKSRERWRTLAERAPDADAAAPSPDLLPLPQPREGTPPGEARERRAPPTGQRRCLSPTTARAPAAIATTC